MTDTLVNGRQPPADAAAPQLPPLYSGLVPLSAEMHRNLRVQDAGYGFAAGLSAIPVAAEEIIAASRHLAVVFAAQAPHMPVVVTGLQPNRNLFVDAEGRWAKDTYIPSYLRRFPFFLVRVAEGKEELALCLDRAAPQFSEAEGEPLFDAEGKPTPMATRAFDFTRAVESAFMKTREMAEGFAAMNLLAPAAIEFQHEGKPLRVDGFHAIQREALMKLTAAQLAELRDKGWLDVIYAHLLSMAGLPELAQKAR